MLTKHIPSPFSFYLGRKFLLLLLTRTGCRHLDPFKGSSRAQMGFKTPLKITSLGDVSLSMTLKDLLSYRTV